ncbi:hypothetical protein [Streptomyces formicae]|uniref:Fibronectin type-III domain-containing protein n=1 Tax=Streptomyces formicae TaxID=1616117 RepID=A0ABY3WJP1_9ACTN|nr:hypothetical protein [Streptomyces formicae]UNM12809.1 hypothetical protein J4032_15945 [Streptomyces formicae]
MNRAASLSRRLPRSAVLAAAVAASLAATVTPPAFAASVLPNGGFEQVTAAGLPEGWGPWKPAGNGTIAVLDGAGPDGSRALELTGDSADDRTAVGRRVTNPNPGRVQFFRVSLDVKAENVTGYAAAVRVQYVGGGVPLTLVGRTSGTHGWRHVTEYVAAPAGTTELSVEPMLDSASGRYLVDNLSVEAVDAAGVTTASPQPTGEIELAWSFTGLGGTPAAYEIHRSGDPDFTPSADTRIRTLKNFTAAEDATTAPGTAYSYKVVALAADGTRLGATAPATATAAGVFEDQQRTDVLSATAVGKETRLAWRFTAGSTGDVTVYAGGHRVGTYDVADGGVTLSSAQRKGATEFSVVLGGKVAATASRGSLQHPRAEATRYRLADARKAVRQNGSTPQKAWQQLLERVQAGPSAYGGSVYGQNCVWGSEAALAHQLTGDDAYAHKAFEGFVASERNLPYLTTTNLLESANCIVRLAQIYDWSYNAWTEQQRAQAHEAFQRMEAFFEAGHHPNIDRANDKASNWVAVIRGAELAMRLAIRGDGDFGMQERRIADLTDQLRRHLDGAYGDTGWDQEGLDYLSYGLTIAAPGIKASLDAGIGALEEPWNRPRFADLLMHSLSLREKTDRLQWGVGSPQGGVAVSPLFFESTPKQQLPYWLWHFEHSMGVGGTTPMTASSQALATILYWPVGVAPRDPDQGPASVRRALLDDHGGAYQFRSRYQDEDDVLVGLTNRNDTHLGWNGYETFGLNLIANDATWARSTAKDLARRELLSKPLIDGRPERRSVAGDDSLGQGETLESRAYEGQGGGFVSLDGHLNYEVAKARRDVVVDLRPVGGADSVIAVHDTFADAASHRYDWQLSPEAGVGITFGETENGTKTFLFTKGDSYLKGWVLAPDGAELSVDKGAFRTTRTGTEADFRIVLATGRGTPPTAAADGSTLTLGDTTYDLDNLAGHRPSAR